MNSLNIIEKRKKIYFNYFFFCLIWFFVFLQKFKNKFDFFYKIIRKFINFNIQ